ncbi:hypothetical protein Q5425_07260 [Amycolatopsis sp. A133]|uniref:hypothetical protein n=1 Tax=Amycolatopsis sp. A133 TaxID=3064472 RepID=UPI0027FF359E|nr:hypothetical protein [Amycolatopsis sp. A133]MDQ7803524.1 hypothetical protein [Amycolatopsis sp. A133]
MTGERGLLREFFLGLAALAAPAGFLLPPADEDDPPQQFPSENGATDPPTDRSSHHPDRRPT